ncbi:Dual specificity protein phosphatase cdc14a [Geranomyces variabilis]|uniref:protein-tyrosine-phosphatase n=1 Tax=Geranomyces variabilis TaxID=109894 RepID=A0AAD5TTM4_9FUNG|nr:Dual specificity protein phosphatase cdc14a [Geranomyces variabilis]
MPYSTLSFAHHVTSASSADILGNAREFIKDKLYFTWLSQAPPQFPDAHFFSIDHVLVYIAFFSDFGPNNISHVVRFCDLVEEKLSNPKTAEKKICLYSSHDPDKRANAAFLICAYMLIVHNQPPDVAFAPLVGAQPGFLPYRDAGYGAATYHITILDCLRGLYKGLTLGLLDLDAVDVDEYEFYEKVENGDFNWLTPKFLALANPKDDPPPSSARSAPSSTGYQKSASGAAYIAGPAAATASWAGGFVSLLSRTAAAAVHAAPTSSSSASTSSSSQTSSTTPRTSAATSSASPSSSSASSSSATTTPKKLRPAYRMADLIAYLRAHSLTTLVRLNNRTYDRAPLQEAGIEHVELYFPDGTTPPDGILMKFLELCETRANPIAVHCKAGLGRTGTLIAAYLMKHYKFSAAEIIAFLRILRPGCVVGPQQNYLQSMQVKLHRMHPTATLPTHVSLLQPPTYPNQQRWKTRPPGSRSTPTPATSARTRHAPTVEEELAAFERLSLAVDDHQETGSGGGVNVHEIGAAGAKLDALPIPGQPRKNVAGAGAAAVISARDKEREMRAQINAAKELAKKTVPPAPYRVHQALAVPTTPTGFGNYNVSTGSTRSSATSASHKPRTGKDDVGVQNGTAAGATPTTPKDTKDLLIVGKPAAEWKS